MLHLMITALYQFLSLMHEVITNMVSVACTTFNIYNTAGQTKQLYNLAGIYPAKVWNVVFQIPYLLYQLACMLNQRAFHLDEQLNMFSYYTYVVKYEPCS